MKIEPLKEADWPAFYRFFKESLAHDLPLLPKDGRNFFLTEEYGEGVFKKRVEKGRKGVIILRIDDEIAGFLVFTKIGGGVMNLNWVLVSPRWRGKGYGRSLIEAGECLAREGGFHKFNLVTFNKDNLPFYGKMGFAVEGIRNFDQWKREKYLMGKVVEEKNE